MTAGRRLAGALAALVITAGCSPKPADTAPGETRTSTTSRTSTSTTSSTSSPPPPPPEWRPATLPETTPTSVLRDVAAADATHAWAVGSDAYSPDEQYTTGVPIVLEWNGSRWSPATLPAVPWKGSFQLVAAGSATDVWVTGGPMSHEVDDNVTFVLHYDGNTWREVPFPAGATPSALSITDLSVADGRAWLVGHRGTEVPVILEWTGQAWREHQPPSTCVRGGTSFEGMPNFCTVTGVKAFPGGEVWAAGNGAWAGFLGPLLFHWDGSAWQAVEVGVNQQKLALQAIDGSSPTDIWAVGDTLMQGGGTLAVHGDGTTWQVVDGLPAKALPGVAVGEDGNPWLIENTREPSATLSTFTAGGWVDTPAPAPPDAVGMSLNAVTAIPGTDRFFAVGAADLPTTPRLLQAVLLEYA